jgi:hypothetical protein
MSYTVNSQYDYQLKISGSATIGRSGIVKPSPAHYTYNQYSGYAGVFSNVIGVSLTNSGHVYGIGTGAGVEFDAGGTVINNYYGIYGGGDGNGGSGVDFVGGKASLINSALIEGGSGGGSGVIFGQNAYGVVENSGRILGAVAAGYGVLGNNTYLHNEGYAVIEAGAGYPNGGRGGIGVALSGNYSTDISHNDANGYIRGGDGGHGTIGIGGAAVLLQNSAEFSNYGLIQGGDGSVQGGGNYYGGGVGIVLESGSILFQHGTVEGGTAAGTGTYAQGGTGVVLSGSSQATNGSGANIYGGGGGSYGSGGLGAQVVSGTTLYNEGGVHGGTGSSPTNGSQGGRGGDGVDGSGSGLLQNIQGVNANTTYSAFIVGGDGGTSLGVSGSVAPGTGGNGGYGVSVTSSSDVDAAFTNTGSIAGGNGGSGLTSGPGGAGAYVGAGAQLTNTAAGAYSQNDFTKSTSVATITGGNGGNAPLPDGSGGAGGAGLLLVGGATAASATNDGTITGGIGGAANADVVNSGSFETFTSGVGGDGVDTAGASYLKNDGTIAGGVGGSGHPAPSGYPEPNSDFTAEFVQSANGGVGVKLGSGTLINTPSGSITGGNGGLYDPAAGTPYTEGGGGVGVALDGGSLTTAGAISGGLGFNSARADSIQFGPEANATMVVDSGATFHGDIGGFAVGDKVDVTNLTPPGSSYYDRNSTFTLSTPEGPLTFTGTTDETFLFNTDGSGGTIVTMACFRRGTQILTDRGEMAIESLQIEDRVTTLSGALKPIRWIGRRSYSGEVAWGDRDVLPILIRRGAIAQNVPTRDLWVSPEHAMYIDGMLIPAALLVNGVSIVQEERVDEVTYFHLEFDAHEVIVVEGALSESFVDDESRQMFDNATEYHRLYPQAASQPARFCAPRVEDGYELEGVRQRLASRAGTAPRAGGAEMLAHRNRTGAAITQLRP